MEPEVVVAHVEAAYPELMETLRADGRSGLGWRFLEKIVQLPLSVPLLDDADRLPGFVRALLGMPEAFGAGEAATPAPREGTCRAGGASRRVRPRLRRTGVFRPRAGPGRRRTRTGRRRRWPHGGRTGPHDGGAGPYGGRHGRRPTHRPPRAGRTRRGSRTPSR
ncbi:hypothetical protein ACFQX6_24155 [Streptosporangium lutulentum]